MYRVLLSMIDGSKKASQNTSSLDVNGGVANPESATALMEAHQKQEALSTQFTDDAIEGDASGTKIRKVRVVKVLTPDQELEKRAIDRLKKLDRRINGLKKKLKKTLEQLQSLSNSEAAGVVAQVSILQCFNAPLEKHAIAVNRISVNKYYEEL